MSMELLKVISPILEFYFFLFFSKSGFPPCPPARYNTGYFTWNRTGEGAGSVQVFFYPSFTRISRHSTISEILKIEKIEKLKIDLP